MRRFGYNPKEKKEMNRSMRLSFCVGIFMLIMKVYAYAITGSSAILSDAAESIVHVFAVGFAAYSMWLSFKPADQDHMYGHDRIAFFSAGFEGAMILFASLYIFYQTIKNWILGVSLENLDDGMLFVFLAMILNGALGWYLVRQGKKFQSLVLEADGKHILTDCFTSLGVIVSLLLTQWTGWLFLDPLIALMIGGNIFWTGWRLMRNSIRGLMDEADPQLDSKIHAQLVTETASLGVLYHRLRHRNSGNRLLIEVHLLFPKNLSIFEAHALATRIEQKLEYTFSIPVECITHLEPIEGHDEIHTQMLGREG